MTGAGGGQNLGAEFINLTNFNNFYIFNKSRPSMHFRRILIALPAFALSFSGVTDAAAPAPSFSPSLSMAASSIWDANAWEARGATDFWRNAAPAPQSPGLPDRPFPSRQSEK